MVRAIEKTLKCEFIIEVDICDRVETLQMLYSVTLIFISRSNIFLLSLCYKDLAQAADFSGRFASTRSATAVELLLFV